MREVLVFYLPWLLSVITIYMTVLAGNKTRWAWAIGLGNQALWLIWIVASASWGLLPMNIALWIVYGRNHWKWMQAESPAMHCGPWKETANGGVWRCETCNCPQGLGCWRKPSDLL